MPNFKRILSEARHRKSQKGRKTKEFDLTEEYLESIWTGKCALSGIEIDVSNRNEKMTLTSASLDRIRSDEGYVRGNVQFVAHGINLAKNQFSDEALMSFLGEIVKSIGCCL